MKVRSPAPRSEKEQKLNFARRISRPHEQQKGFLASTRASSMADVSTGAIFPLQLTELASSLSAIYATLAM
jgi:hypothetical protein